MAGVGWAIVVGAVLAAWVVNAMSHRWGRGYSAPGHNRGYCRNRDFTTRRAPTPPDASYIPDASGPDALYDTVRRVVQCLKQHSAPPPLLSNTLPPPPPPSLKQHSAPPLLLSNTLHRGRAVWGL